MTYVLRLFDFWIFFLPFPFSPFLFFFLQWLTFYWACLRLKTSKKAASRRAIFTVEQPGVVAGNFGLSFFAQLLEYFCAYLRLHSADLSDLGIIGKIFFSCRRWVQMMPILVKSDDVRSGRKAKAPHRGYGQHRGQWVNLNLCHNHLLVLNPTFVPSLSQISVLSCITSCLALPGFLMDTLLNT